MKNKYFIIWLFGICVLFAINSNLFTQDIEPNNKALLQPITRYQSDLRLSVIQSNVVQELIGNGFVLLQFPYEKGDSEFRLPIKSNGNVWKALVTGFHYKRYSLAKSYSVTIICENEIYRYSDDSIPDSVLVKHLKPGDLILIDVTH